MANTAQLKQVYKEQIAPALQKQFNYSSKMQTPVLKKSAIMHYQKLAINNLMNNKMMNQINPKTTF